MSSPTAHWLCQAVSPLVTWDGLRASWGELTPETSSGMAAVPRPPQPGARCMWLDCRRWQKETSAHRAP